MADSDVIEEEGSTDSSEAEFQVSERPHALLRIVADWIEEDLIQARRRLAQLGEEALGEGQGEEVRAAPNMVRPGSLRCTLNEYTLPLRPPTAPMPRCSVVTAVADETPVESDVSNHSSDDDDEWWTELVARAWVRTKETALRQSADTYPITGVFAPFAPGQDPGPGGQYPGSRWPLAQRTARASEESANPGDSADEVPEETGDSSSDDGQPFDQQTWNANLRLRPPAHTVTADFHTEQEHQDFPASGRWNRNAAHPKFLLGEKVQVLNRLGAGQALTLRTYGRPLSGNYHELLDDYAQVHSSNLRRFPSPAADGAQTCGLAAGPPVVIVGDDVKVQPEAKKS
jgi:hypothetical protein